MGGLLHHLLLASLLAIPIYRRFERATYVLAIFIGNFFPDLIGLLYASLMIGSFDLSLVLASGAWLSFERDALTIGFWCLLQAIFISLYLWLYGKFGKTLKEFEDLLALLILGFLTHILLDLLVIETGFWI